MDSVDFGSISSSGGSFRLSGAASNLDIETLVESSVEARRIPALRIENRVSQNEAEITALQDLRGLLGDLQNSVAGLRNPPGTLGRSENLFEQKQAFFSSNTSTSPAELLSVTTDNSAQLGSFEITVDQLATARKFSTGSFASATQTLGENTGGGPFTATIEIGLDGGATTASIDVDSDFDVFDLRDAINATSSQSGVTANVLQVAENDFRLVTTASETGREVDIAVTAGQASLLDDIGITNGGGGFANAVQDPQQAQLTIDGVAVTRSDNQFDDVLQGVTIDLFQADPGTTVTVDVEPSLGDVKQALTTFVDSYNAFRDFVDQQSVVSEGGDVDEGSALFGNSTLRDAVRTVSDALGSGVDGLGEGALTTLRDIGITLGDNARLEIDDGVLDNALLTNVDAVRDVLEFDFSADSANLRIFDRTNALNDSQFTVEIVDADNDGVPDSATIGGVAAEIDGQLIRGAEGSDYEGLELFWNGVGDETIEVNATQGVADTLYNAIERLNDGVDGRIQTEIDSLGDTNTALRADIERINVRAEDYRETLIQRFSALESALSLTESLLTQIRSTSDAWNGAS